jgi:hypothetical protein
LLRVVGAAEVRVAGEGQAVERVRAVTAVRQLESASIADLAMRPDVPEGDQMKV